VMVSFTLGITAPVASVTVPRILPVASCAVPTHANAAKPNAQSSKFFKVNSLFPELRSAAMFIDF
jgi:hypothetical protein